MTDKRRNMHGMERYHANRWEIFKSDFTWYFPQVMDALISAAATMTLMGIIVFGAMLFA